MSSIQLTNVCLDYILKSGSSSIKKTALDVVNRCLKRKTNGMQPIRNSTYRALNDLNFKIEKGDRVGLLGRNGAGKSTLLRVLANIYKPTLGEINIHGQVANLFDVSAGMNIESTGYENIFNLAIMRRISKKDVKKMMADIEEFTELGDFLKNPVKIYSAGMILKLAFAVATAIPSEIMLIDEIIGVGDSHFIEKATKRLENMIQQSQILVLASHSNEIIKRFCNKVLILEKGEVQYFGETEKGIEWYLNRH